MKCILFLAALSLIQAQSSQQPQSPPLLPIAGPLPPPGSQPLPGEIPQGLPSGSIPVAPTGPQIPEQKSSAGRPILLPQGSPVRPQPSPVLPPQIPQGPTSLPIQGQPIDQRIAGSRPSLSQIPPSGPIIGGPSKQTQPGSAPPSQDMIAALGLNGVLSKPFPTRRISEQQFSYFLSRVQAQAQLGSGPPSRASFPIAGGPSPVTAIERPPPSGQPPFSGQPPLGAPPSRRPLPPSQPQPVQQRSAVLPPSSPSAQGIPAKS